MSPVLIGVLVKVPSTVLMADLRNIWHVNDEDHFIPFQVWPQMHFYIVEAKLP